jgi:hypothetical protein
MEKVCKITRTHPQFNGSNDILLMQGGPGVWDLEGRFAFIPTEIHHNSTIDLINRGASKIDTFTLIALVDPKYHSASFDQARLAVAEDENGTSLLSRDSNRMGFWNPGFSQSWVFVSTVPLSFPETFGRRLAKVQGTMEIRLPMSVDTLKIPDLVQAVGTASVAGKYKVDVVTCSFDGKDAVHVHLQITKLTLGPSTVPGGIFQEFQSARVVDSTGMQLLPSGVGGGSDMQYDWQGQFIGNGRQPKPPFSLRWETISKVESVTVPFKFTNLPLPPE